MNEVSIRRGNYLNNNKNFLILTSLTIFILLFFATLVTAQEKSPLETFKGWVKDLSEGNIGSNAIFPKLLLTFLVVLIVFVISNTLPFLKSSGEGIRWTFSIVVAILSFIYVKPGDIRAILVGYEALGIVLTSIIPLVILIFFTMEFSKNHPILGDFLNPMLYIGFCLYSLYKWLTIGETALGWLYILTIIISILWIFLGPKIVEKIGLENKLKGYRAMNESLGQSVAYTHATAQAGENMMYTKSPGGRWMKGKKQAKRVEIESAGLQWP